MRERVRRVGARGGGGEVYLQPVLQERGMNTLTVAWQRPPISLPAQPPNRRHPPAPAAPPRPRPPRGASVGRALHGPRRTRCQGRLTQIKQLLMGKEWKLK